MMNAPVPLLSVLLGAIILFFGRKLFWLSVAAVGFAGGVELAPLLVTQPAPATQLTIAIVLGFIGALLALFLQKIAVAVAGFAIGGRLAVALATSFVLDHTSHYWLTFVIGGIVGAIMLIALFGWALILLSSLLGAHLILNSITLPQTGATILMIALTAFGVLVQTAIFRRSRRGAG